MSPSPSDRQFDKQEARRKAEADASRAEQMAATKAYARRIVALFNARASRGRGYAFFPTIKCALVAETPIVRSVCPGCQQITHTDLRGVDHHPLATIAAIIPKVSCKRCRPNAPFARITGLQSAATDDARPWAATWGMMPPKR